MGMYAHDLHDPDMNSINTQSLLTYNHRFAIIALEAVLHERYPYGFPGPDGIRHVLEEGLTHSWNTTMMIPGTTVGLIRSQRRQAAEVGGGGAVVVVVASS